MEKLFWWPAISLKMCFSLLFFFNFFPEKKFEKFLESVCNFIGEK